MKPTFIALLALVIAVGCGTAPASNGTTSSAIKNTSKAKPGTVLWEFETGDSVESSPAIGSDGTVYVGSGYLDKKLYAI